MTIATLNIDETERALSDVSYCEGRAAFLSGEPNSSNPQEKSNGRLEWFCGWFDAKEEVLLHGRRQTDEEAFASFRRGREVFKA